MNVVFRRTAHPEMPIYLYSIQPLHGMPRGILRGIPHMI